MYQVTIKGRNLEELKKAVNDINVEINTQLLGISTARVLLEKDLSEMYEDKEGDVHVDKNVEVVEEIKWNNTIPETSNVVPLTGELDSEGLPWDSRIHSNTKNKNSDGTWRNLRGVDKELLNKVRYELLSKRTTPVVVQEVVEAPVLPAVIEQAMTVPGPVVAPAPAMPSMVAKGHTVETFIANFPMILANLITEGKVTQEYINQLKAYFGVEQIWAINDTQKTEMFGSFTAAGLIG